MRGRARRLFAFALTAFVSVVVMLPLLWMLLTALKQPGQALKFELVPTTAVQSAQYGLLWSWPEVVLEYQNPEAQDVAVTGEIVGGANVRLHRDGDHFFVRFSEVPAGEHTYSFVVDGVKMADPNVERTSPSGDSIIAVASDALTSNGPLSAGMIDSACGVEFVYRDDDAERVSARLTTGRLIPLAKGADGRWSACVPFDTLETLESKSPVTFVSERSFVTALGDIYTFNNFTEILFNRDFPFISFFLNSLIVATLAGVITVVICTGAGYAFAKKRFPGRDTIFYVLLASMLVPGLVFVVPQFALVSELGWINSFQGMVLPHVANVFGLFLMRQYIETIPDSLLEAARIDGASEWQVFRIAVVPLAMPIVITLFLITFVSQWSNFLWQFITNTPDSPYRTLPVGLNLFKGQYDIQWELIMAGACFSIIPVAIIFVAAQRYFIQGMTSGAVKE